MAEGMRRQDPPARRALHEALLNQERFDNILDGVARFGQSGGDRLDSRWAATERESDRLKIAPVHRIEPDFIDIEDGQHFASEIPRDFWFIADDREIANPAQQT